MPFVEGCGRCAWCRIERIIGLDEAAVLLPAFDTACPVGMTMIDPHRR